MAGIYFVSSNDYKIAEYSRIFKVEGVTIVPVKIDIQELQSIEPNEIIRDKAIKAYAAIRKPIIVEHSSLSLSAIGGLPRGLTKPFWDILKDHVCDIAQSLKDTEAQMIVCMAFCDGKNIYTVIESVAGNIASIPLTGVFHLDRVFVPKGESVALAGMAQDDRDQHSPRRPASRSLIKKRIQQFVQDQLIGKI